MIISGVQVTFKQMVQTPTFTPKTNKFTSKVFKKIRHMDGILDGELILQHCARCIDIVLLIVFCYCCECDCGDGFVD